MIENIFEYIEEVISKNAIVNEYVNNRIFFYEVEESDEDLTNDPFIIINSLTPTNLRTFASNYYYNQSFVIQIDVESKDDNITKAIANAITNELFKFNLFKLDGGLDEYFEETQRFVDSRRYEGIPKIIK